MKIVKYVTSLFEVKETKKVELSANDQDALTQVFSSLLPNNSKSNFIVTFENLSADSQPAFRNIQLV